MYVNSVFTCRLTPPPLNPTFSTPQLILSASAYILKLLSLHFANPSAHIGVEANDAASSAAKMSWRMRYEN